MHVRSDNPEVPARIRPGYARGFSRGPQADRLGRELFGIDAESMDRLIEYSWPGNIRELQALEESNGRVFGPTGAATRLGIPPATLESKVQKARTPGESASTPLGLDGDALEWSNVSFDEAQGGTAS